MGRFDRDETPRDEADVAAETATEQLKSTIEHQVRQVVEEAMERAATIEARAKAGAEDMERDARQRADAIVRESHERANRALTLALERAEGMRDATETLQSELTKVIASFKEEVDLLTTELRAAGSEPGTTPEGHSPATSQQVPHEQDEGSRRGLLRRG
jgi:flagellar biosynthesis/type III secretory pathway protein FliH